MSLRRAGLVVLAALFLAACAAPRPTESRRDALWRIVSQCLDTGVRDYCSACPSPLEGRCEGRTDCLGTTEVWAATLSFVAIRDIKMCGCPATFVHGLALPRQPVTGVEDSRRPEGLWPFAWAVAKARIPDESSIALVVNPPAQRTQDQLHIHLVRLRPDGRARLAARAPVRVSQLEHVWEVAARRAASTGLLGYGVIVVRDTATADFLVVAQADSPEYEYTEAECR